MLQRYENTQFSNQGGWSFTPAAIDPENIQDPTQFEYRWVKGAQLPLIILMTNHREDVVSMGLNARTSNRGSLALFMQQAINEQVEAGERAPGTKPLYLLAIDDEAPETAQASLLAPLMALELNAFDENTNTTVTDIKSFFQHFAANLMIRDLNDWVAMVDLDLSRMDTILYFGGSPFKITGNSAIGIINMVANLPAQMDAEHQRKIIRAANSESSPLKNDSYLQNHAGNERVPVTMISQLLQHSMRCREKMTSLMQASRILSAYADAPTLQKALDLFVFSLFLSENRQDLITHSHEELQPERIVSKLEQLVGLILNPEA